MCSYYKIHIYEDENNVSDSSDDSDESNNFWHQLDSLFVYSDFRAPNPD
jgi:hypothetical protein